MIPSPRPEKQVYLRPGELYIGTEPALVTTVLGSCVSVTLFHARFRLAAICHGIFADPVPTSYPEKKSEGPYRYLSVAIPAMVNAFCRLGITPAETEVKLFGGASFCKCCKHKESGDTVGGHNIQRAREILNEARLQIARCHVGGEVGRKLIFDTTTGTVLLKTLLGTSSTSTTPCHESAH